MSWHGLRAGDTVNNEQLCGIFQCSPQGGMRRSLKKNSLIIVSNHVKSLYDDRWVNDILHYTGMGTRGDQSKTTTQNKTLNESKTNGVEVYLFEVYKEMEYTYRGRVELAEEVYQENQPDEKGELRKVWIFPVSVIGETENYKPSEDLVRSAKEKHEKRARKMSNADLKKRACHSRKTTAQKQGMVSTYERDPYVTEYAKRRAKGTCQLCKQPAPFQNKWGEPYLETHHIIWLARGGEDTIKNTVALCPNCHKKMHVLDLQDDVNKLSELALQEDLQDETS
ncbi:HNH endonuclease signature motif containing protein [Paenibacillus sp. FSL H8-0104]|uniref:HNH endonuclease n=1 Tax=Paenibacillus sp. FSL H8-0104 TaxID=2954509 RepID=UPI0030FD32C0